MGLLVQLWATLFVTNVFVPLPFLHSLGHWFALLVALILLHQIERGSRSLLGCAFARFVIMALGVGLIYSIGVEGILVVFSCTSAGSIITEEL
jgi:uncharacterized membrane protein